MPRRAYQILVCLAAALLGYLSIAVTAANTFASAAPSLALGFWPSAVAEARTADAMILGNPRARTFDGPAAHALTALRRNPTLAVASRVLALQALTRRDERLAARLFEYSEGVSRRDVPTQLWLLEQQVQRNDIPGALEHFRIVLRVSPGARELLFPVLTGALAEDYLVAPIANRAFGEPWEEAFLRYASTNARDPVDAAKVIMLLARRGSTPPADMVQGISGRLIEHGRLDVAGRLYRLIDPQWNPNDIERQLDGGFTRSEDLPPFGWTLAQDVAFRGAPVGAAADNPALNVSAEQAVDGSVARKLLLLRPGRYRLAGRFGVVEREGDWQLAIGIACGEAATPVLSPATPLAGNGGAFNAEFTVPAGCRAPWLSLNLDRSGGGRIQFWVDDLRLSGR
ncbi:MAG TPA: hypothetical protein VLK25_01465 [Allosphingosinicella sp.]|nr:hypothetical protein [Allosphingosinicella sp.]